MLDLGVISQIEKYLTETFSFSAKRKDNPKFLDYQEDWLNSEFFKANWEIVFYRNPPIPINEQIKSNINKYFEQLLSDVTDGRGKIIKAYNGFIGSLLDMDFLLSQFLYKTELNEDSELYQIIYEYYKFLKDVCEINGFTQEIPEPFNVDPLTRYLSNQKIDKQNMRPNCPSCNSNKIISYGINWYCKSCKRQYRKQSRI